LGKKNKIVVGPGRGSAGGSLVAYLAGITNIEPIKHNLLFERFLAIQEEFYITKKDFGIYD